MKWNDVYTIEYIELEKQEESRNDYDRSEYKKIEEKLYKCQVDYNRKEYEKIEETIWRNLDCCVKYAIENKNHAAFVKYYLKNAKEHHVLFVEMLEQFLEEKEIEPRKCNHWGIMEDSCWISPNYEFGEQQVSSVTISSWKNVNNERLPGKYEIVQMGICMGLSYKETNRLLQSAGREMLYILDVADAICMYYLDYYCTQQKGDVSERERLKEVKSFLNKYLLEKSQELFVQKRSKNNKNIMQRASRFPFWQIEDRISSVKEKIEAMSTLEEREDERADYLTLIYEKKFEECQEVKNLEDFIRHYDFGILHFGFMMQTKEMVRARKFWKNFYQVRFNLVSNENYCFLKSYFMDSSDKKLAFINFTMRKHYKKIIQNPNLSDEELKEMLKKIWKIHWLVSDLSEFKSNPSVSAGSFSKINEMTEGRNVFKSDRNRYIQDEEENDAYQYAAGDKENIIKFCIACGMEDEIGRYLKIAGYWEKDYFCDWSETTEPHAVLNRADYLVIYALKYREALIEQWTERLHNQFPDRDTGILRIEMKEKFPFLQLMLTITRDLQFVMSQIAKDACVREPEKTITIRNLLYQLDYQQKGKLLTDKKWYLQYQRYAKKEYREKDEV